MSETPPILIFSDAHFGSHGATQEEIKIHRFKSILDAGRVAGAEVFFLGDLFDVWFEYKHWIPKVHLPVLSAIRAFTDAGGTFHFLVGNHDCWIEDYFERELGATVHRHDMTLVRQGLRLYISHGDGKSPSESGYRLWQRVSRSRIGIGLYRLIPADWAFRLARSVSGHSRELSAAAPEEAFAQYDSVATELLAGGFDAVIMGHLHRGWLRRLDGGWWINSGEFYDKFDYVVLKSGEFQMARWNPTAGAGII